MEDVCLEKHLDNLKDEINKSPQGFRLKIKVCANSKKNSLEFFDQPSDVILKVKINKPAVDGKANKAVIEYLSEIFNLPKSNISILNGEISSQKCLLIMPR